MAQIPNEQQAAQAAVNIINPIAITQQNVIRDKSVMLNGGNPIQIGFNTTIAINPINTGTYKDIVAKADPSVFPAGLKGLPTDFQSFITQIEPALFQWLGNAKNLSAFISNPINAIQSFCTQNKLQMPADINSFLLQTQKANTSIKYNTPGVQYKSVTASINQPSK
jgi:hypothetical protein